MVTLRGVFKQSRHGEEPTTDSTAGSEHPEATASLGCGEESRRLLQEEEWIYRRLFQAAPEAIALLDRTGRVIDVNGRLFDLLGYERASIVGKRLIQLPFLPWRSKVTTIKKLPRRMVGLDPEPYELEFLTKTGEARIGKVMATPLHNDEGKIVADLVMIADVTEQRLAENRLVRAKREVDEANTKLRQALEHEGLLRENALQASQAKSQFLANISHEIRTPLNGIIGMIRLILDTELREEQRDCGQTISDCAETLLRIVDDILDFTKIEEGRLGIDVSEFSLRKSIESIGDTFGTAAHEKGLRYECVVDDEVPDLVRGDGGRLSRVLECLVGNAIKFTDKGEIRVRVSCEEGDRDSVVVRFAVDDTGTGIPKGRLHELFEPFTQADASMTREFGGTGLGLAISKGIVSLMGGQIGVNSPSTVANRRDGGSGSTFWFTVTLQRCPTTDKGVPEPDVPAVARRTIRTEAPVTSEGIPEHVRGKARAGCVLLAEDNAINQKVALKMLEKLGYCVDTVVNGKEAVEALTRRRYDLVLMDVQMPEMDGLEATSAIRDPAGGVLDPHVPIIAMTANAMPDHRQLCLRSGMDDYITKPVTPDALQGVLGKWTGRSDRTEPREETVPREPLPREPAGGDFDRADLLARLGNDEQLFTEIVALFLEDAPRQIEAIGLAVDAGNSEDVWKNAHSLKGASANMGAENLRQAASELENAGRAGNLDDAVGLLSAIQTRFDVLKETLEGSDKQWKY